MELTADQAQVVYLSHGGGPLPILGDPGHRGMVDFLTRLPAQLRKPRAVLVISAHWEETEATIIGAEAPPLLYDYYGFPDEAYRLTYPAPGDPGLASRIADLLREGRTPARIAVDRGFDHGLFIPLLLMYPEAGIPCLQLSLIRGLHPARHLVLGAALRDLMRDDILVVGSGFSFHNLRAFSRGADRVPDKANDAFQDWLSETCTGSLTQTERERRLTHWEEEAPWARHAHPREEHLLPLHVCVGMAGRPGVTVFDDVIMGKRAVAFLW